MEIIEAKNLSRDFKIYNSTKGTFQLFKDKITNNSFNKRVVDNISFSINRGDFVGYLGPNGAGKSTTIKMLSGILVPTEGTVKVLNLEPYKNRKHHARNIGVVFGQRSQLWWDLPLIDSFNLLGKIYDLPIKKTKENIDRFTSVLEMSSFLHTPVRQLSLGQRMRGDIAASLLHDPPILFLDEPTIGLDILAKEKIQDFLNTLNRESAVTVILTTHNVDDIEKLCKRVIFIDKGRKIFDGSSKEMTMNYGREKFLELETSQGISLSEFSGYSIKKIGFNSYRVAIYDENMIGSIINKVGSVTSIKKISIQESKIEDIVKNMYLSSDVDSKII